MDFGLHTSTLRNWQHTVFIYVNLQVTYHITTNNTRRELYRKQIRIAEIRITWFLAHWFLLMWTPKTYFHTSYLAGALTGTWQSLTENAFYGPFSPKERLPKLVMATCELQCHSIITSCV
jgi:hypothetical protein